MYNHKTIKEQLSTLVGLRQNDNPAFPQLSPSLVYDDDGDKILVHHPLINIENLDATVRNYSKYQFTAYNAATEYEEGDRVSYLGISYEALQDGDGHQPNTSPDWWGPVSLINLFLEDVFGNAAEDVVMNVFNHKKITGQVKTVLKSTQLYVGAGNFTDYIINEGNLVGVEIKLKSYNNILAIIQRVGLQLTAAQNDLTMYLYHSSQLEPIATISVDQTKVNSFQWHEANLRLNYLSEDLEPGGVYYLMYDQNDLVGQAIKKNHNFDQPPCQYCGPYDLTAYMNYSSYFSIRGVRVKAANRNVDDDLNLWDITKTEHTPDTNYGMNMEVSVRCDVTRFLVQSKDLFGYAMRDMVIHKILEVMANSTRQNNAQTKLDVLARAELTAPVAGGLGFKKQLENQLQAVNFEISNLDAMCMPCADRTSGVRYGVAGLAR